MYNTGEKMTTKLAVSITEKGNTYCSKLLRTMKEKELLNWIGSSKFDSTQYYVLNF